MQHEKIVTPDIISVVLSLLELKFLTSLTQKFDN